MELEEASGPAWVGELLRCRFRALRPADPGEGERLAIRVPRFDGSILRRWLVPILRRPDFHVRLDDLGTAAWRLFDGVRTGEEIAAALDDRFPGQPDLRLRLAVFLRTLVAQGHAGAELPDGSGDSHLNSHRKTTISLDSDPDSTDRRPI
jgi:hypothetical protein